MCPPSNDTKKDNTSTLKTLVGFFGLTTVGLLVATIVLAVQNNSNNNDASSSTAQSSSAQATTTDDFLQLKASSTFFSSAEEDNVCAGAKLAFENKLCADLGVAPQAGANITKGYVGGMDVGDIEPNTKPYFQSSMCPVNVHWHLGAEHYSLGEFDENGHGPHDAHDHVRDLAEGEVQDGYRCHHYDAKDAKFTTPYNWKHCVGMEVGETYEVHWPHSAAGACGTVNQYQTPFYDGVFCNLPLETFQTLAAQDIASAVGVHGQVFTIVNDESYFYPDMIRGMIIDKEMGKDISYYTGSTTGETRTTPCALSTPPLLGRSIASAT